ncbi:hypothetical protein [Salinicoccus roseus]|uniref:Uncharacterized protein n=1 Tax=Salinicoccus roseus TaxID=45670 RepID=A0ABT4YLX4_9STAP|nr:hypothetical protein [Salinicoccus roseus]MDB0581366.1 hypothetical protein [Salinicoccus roseus]
MTGLVLLIYAAAIMFIAACSIVIVGVVMYCRETIRKRKGDME